MFLIVFVSIGLSLSTLISEEKVRQDKKTSLTPKGSCNFFLHPDKYKKTGALKDYSNAFLDIDIGKTQNYI